MMRQFIDFISQPWFGFAVGTLLSVVSIAYSVYTYVKTKKDKEPSFASRTTCFIQGASSVLPGLKVTYVGHGEPIDDVAITRFTFWNNGKDTVNRSDIVEPLEIHIASPHQILECTIVEKSFESNGFDIQRNREKTKIGFTFKYVDYREACVLQIVHSATSGESLSFSGKIKGATIREVQELDRRRTMRRSFYGRIGATAFMIAICILPFVRMEDRTYLRLVSAFAVICFLVPSWVAFVVTRPIPFEGYEPSTD